VTGPTGPTGPVASTVVPALNSIGDAAYTLILGDVGKEVSFALSITNRTLTVPTNASVAFPIGSQLYITVSSGTTGILSITGAGGVTIRGSVNLRFIAATAEASACTLWKIGTDTWLAI
jgi:hypothetical protein